jgi:hypothetical protein
LISLTGMLMAQGRCPAAYSSAGRTSSTVTETRSEFITRNRLQNVTVAVVAVDDSPELGEIVLGNAPQTPDERHHFRVGQGIDNLRAVLAAGSALLAISGRIALIPTTKFARRGCPDDVFRGDGRLVIGRFELRSAFEYLCHCFVSQLGEFHVPLYWIGPTIELGIWAGEK